MNSLRIKELERAETKLLALEAGGVDNWSGYDGSMAGIREAQELEKKRETLIQNLFDELGECIDEPAGHGCGYGFAEDAEDRVMKILEKMGVIFEPTDKKAEEDLPF